MNNETNHTDHGTTQTTVSTWGRVAEQQMERMSEFLAQGAKMQAAILEQSKELFDYNMKLAGECQQWATETQRKVTGQIFRAK